MPHLVTGARHDRSSNRDFDGARNHWAPHPISHRPPSTPAKATASPEAPTCAAALRRMKIERPWRRLPLQSLPAARHLYQTVPRWKERV
jgi:hypothetical protein